MGGQAVPAREGLWHLGAGGTELSEDAEPRYHVGAGEGAVRVG